MHINLFVYFLFDLSADISLYLFFCLFSFCFLLPTYCIFLFWPSIFDMNKDKFKVDLQRLIVLVLFTAFEASGDLPVYV